MRDGEEGVLFFSPLACRSQLGGRRRGGLKGPTGVGHGKRVRIKDGRKDPKRKEKVSQRRVKEDPAGSVVGSYVPPQPTRPNVPDARPPKNKQNPEREKLSE